MAVLTVWTQGDGLLSWLAPIGLAVAAGTALVVDLDPDGPDWGGGGSLADLVRSGPRSRDLRPEAQGLALLSNGGVNPGEATEVVEALKGGWPVVVFRSAEDHGRFAPVVPVYPLLPGALGPTSGRPCVWQQTGLTARSPEMGIVVPQPGSRIVRSLLHGVVPRRMGRWRAAWASVWGYSWT